MKALLLGCLLCTSAVHAAEHAEAMMRATFKLFNKDSTATCFLLRDGGDVFLVTAAHTVEKASGETSLLVLRDRHGDAWKRRDEKVAIREGDKPLWTKHPDADLAVLKLAIEVPEEATLPVAAVKADGFPRFGDPVMLLTYPARVEANGAGFPIARRAIIASYPAEPMKEHPTFLLDATAWDGDSGGPVFADAGDGRPQIVGLVIERINHVENIKSDRETRKIETPMGLSKALGAPLILDTLRRAKTAVGVPATSK